MDEQSCLVFLAFWKNLFALHTKCKDKWSKSPISSRNDLQKILMTDSLINIRYSNQQFIRN